MIIQNVKKSSIHLFHSNITLAVVSIIESGPDEDYEQKGSSVAVLCCAL